jgi:hypothetical protein
MSDRDQERKHVSEEEARGDGGFADRRHRSRSSRGRPEAEELEEEAAERNPDRQTRREALELELMEEDRSEEGEDVGDEIR